MPNTMTTTDHARHLIALHLGAENQHVDNMDADRSWGYVLDAAHAIAQAYASPADRSDGAALRVADARFPGGLPAFVVSVLTSVRLSTTTRLPAPEVFCHCDAYAQTNGAHYPSRLCY